MGRAPIVLALASGVPALVYEVVWTRELALLAGSQVEAISVVLVAFFGGLGLGARVLGGVADRVRFPLRLYALLEGGASAVAAASIPLLRVAGAHFPGSELPSLVLCGAILLPVTFLLGGALPALLRATVTEPGRAAAAAGWLVGWNTLGSVLGVGVAVLAIPGVGLHRSVLAGALWGAGLAATALLLSRRPERSHPAGPRGAGSRPLYSGWIVAAAGVAGVVTLAYEVLAARMAALALGSTLYSWAAVLALFLLGLAAGNAIFARRAAATARPAVELGWLELAAALAVAVGLHTLAPGVTGPVRGITPGAGLAVALGVFPPALLMGAAFPFFVRLALQGGQLGTGFGAVSAANTAGGVAGALLAAFVLLPGLGPVGAAAVCAGGSASLGLAFLVRGRAGALGWLAAPLLLSGSLLALWPQDPAPPGGSVVHVAHGRQASVVVVHRGDRRDLFVDGDPEASTGGAARRTEELLAVLPLLLHPEPRSFLEIGFGSGITLGTAAAFPLERIDCVEIAGSVLGAARFFEPDNGGVASGVDSRVRIVRGDGRAFLAGRRGAYDVAVANTLHPWSVGATGLYSKEYFARLAGALRPGGIAVQWLPVERIGEEALAAILRTLLSVFPDGSLWWGDGNLLVVGRMHPAAEADTLRRRARGPAAQRALDALGIPGAAELGGRRLADFAALRTALGPGPVLRDDRPALEVMAARRGSEPTGALELVARIVAAGAEDARTGTLRLWVEGELAHRAGRPERAASRNALALAAGSPLAWESRIARLVEQGHAALDAGDLAAAGKAFRAALDLAPRHRAARYGLAFSAAQAGDLGTAREEAQRLVTDHPEAGEGWLLIGEIQQQRGDLRGARAAFERTLEVDPHNPRARAALRVVSRELRS